MYSNLRVLIVVGEFHKDIAETLVSNATLKLKQCCAAVVSEVVRVPGAFEVPAALAFSIMSDREVYDGYLALGCILKGSTEHNFYVSSSVFSAISDIAAQHAVPLGTGIITAETKELALERASVDGLDVGGNAAVSMLRMVELYKRFLG